jgi:response regulator NasT
VKVLLADADDERAACLEASLVAAQPVEVIRLGPDEGLREAALAHRPDVVIVDMARPDRDSLEGIRQVAAADPLPIVLFVDADDAAFMEEAIAAGVSSYNVVGVALPDIKPIVRAAIAMFHRFRRVEAELRKAEASLDERRAVDRAKALLMRRRGCTEPQAYALLRRQAMDTGRRIAEVAAEFVARAGDA